MKHSVWHSLHVCACCHRALHTPLFASDKCNTTTFYFQIIWISHLRLLEEIFNGSLTENLMAVILSLVIWVTLGCPLVESIYFVISFGKKSTLLCGMRHKREMWVICRSHKEYLFFWSFFPPTMSERLHSIWTHIIKFMQIDCSLIKGLRGLNSSNEISFDCSLHTDFGKYLK